MNTDITLGNTLRNLRLAKNLSQHQLANKLFVDRSSVSNWENGRRIPDSIIILRLAGILGVDVSSLIDAAAVDPEPPNVIIVDDEELLLAGVMPVLTEAMPGAAITGFSKVSEAVSFARNNRIALALLDIELGKNNGLDLCRTLTEIYPLTNIVFLTSYPDYALKAWDTSASGFLVKPLQIEDIKEQLTKLRHSVKGLNA